MGTQLNIDDMQARDVVVDMARILKVDYHEDNNEICIDLPDNLGTGFIKAVSFDFGLGVLEVDCKLKGSIELHLNNDLVQPLKMIFNRESALEHWFAEVDETHEIRNLENAILSCNSSHGHVFKIPGGKPICLLILEINRKSFEKKIEDFLADMDEELEQLFRDVNGINLFFYSGYYSLETAKLLEEFTECDHSGFMRSVYLEGKAYEILTEQLKQYLDDLNDLGTRKILRQSTVTKIKEAAEIIEDELDNVPNIIALSHRVGLNQNTLQNGFNILFKTSVNQYVRNERIERAKKLLETTNLNITEITYKIGINSRSYFSKLFKERYGVSPKQYADKVRKAKKASKSA